MERLTHTSRGGRGRPCLTGIVTLACAVAITAPGPASATSGSYTLKAHLTGDTSRVGAFRPTGSLTGRLTLAAANSSFTWTLAFHRLSGPALSAGIYYGKSARASQLAMLLCNTCFSGSKSYYHGAYVASPAFVRAVRGGRAYVVIRTKKHPAGEIRGRISVMAA